MTRMNPGRLAGLLYLLMAIPGPFILMYLPDRLMVSGNAAATAHNVAASEFLVRLGIALQVASHILFVFVVLALYELFKDVRRQAFLMVLFVLLSVPMALLNEANSFAALVLARGTDFVSVLTQPQRDVLTMLFLHLHNRGIDLTAVFWGLWLFPLGILVYRSGFMPRLIGILLVINGFVYPILTFTTILFPQYKAVVFRAMTLPELGEVWFMLWLLIRGARPRAVAAPPPGVVAPAV
jgi:hypothetical protein